MNLGGFTVRELIGGVIGVLSVSALGAIGVIQTLQHLPFQEPSALSAVAGASVAVFLSNAGNSSTAEKMSNGLLTAIATAVQAQPQAAIRTVRASDLPPVDIAPTAPVAIPSPTFPSSP